MWFFRAVALDLDGTLTDGARLSGQAVGAIRAARADRRVILVTGRILADLDAAFPGLAGEFDAVVTENGAVLHTCEGTRPLAAPVDAAMVPALAAKGISAHTGEVLLAISGDGTPAAMEAAGELGLDCQVVHNRGEAMILPAGVTKGTGLLAALDELGLSAHNTVAAGDAENDLALLRTAEVGAAVANAVPSLAAHADLRLASPDGAGVAELLTSPLLSGREQLCPGRRWFRIGSFGDGQPVLMPGSQASILIAGDTGTGKSYLAGLLAERWIDAGYSVLVIDPEGDHAGLAHRPGVHLVDAAVHLPTPTDLLALARPARGSLILDLSGLPEPDKCRYLLRLPAAIAAERAGHGIPHWVVTDEAQVAAGSGGAEPAGPGLAEPGTCLVTWRPGALPASLRQSMGFTLTITAPPAAAGATVAAGRGPARPFTLDHRVSPHVRHEHKYTATALPPERRFYFCARGEQTAAAATLQEFSRHIRHCDPAVLGYHLPRGDFSRWITGTLADSSLGEALAVIERDLVHRQAAELERARQRILLAISSRYPGTAVARQGKAGPAPGG